MTAAFKSLVESARTAAINQYAVWNADLFETLCRRPAVKVDRAVGNVEHGDRVVSAYLQLVSEAIARGYLETENLGISRDSLLAHCLTERFPAEIGKLSFNESLTVLARTWNLCEGLLREPRWVDRYVMARIDELKKLTDLEPFLTRVLQPVLGTHEPARWTGTLQVSVLQTRWADETFLPGDMFLVAPTVVCVRDRRRNVAMGVLLQKQLKSQLLGRMPLLDPAAVGSQKEVKWQPNQLRIGKQSVKVPHLNKVHQHLVASTGFVVASATDSQQLWVVESS